jgi:type 1 fimbriae regulatory protein FimB/type 1 fimbriae regulatory protein FimE
VKSHLKLVKPDAENRAVALTRLANSKYRSREHLTPSEVEKLIEAATARRDLAQQRVEIGAVAPLETFG